MKLSTFLILLSVVGTLGSWSPTSAQAQDAEERRDRRVDKKQSRERVLEPYQLDPLETGFVIVDGQFVEPPYQIEWDGNQLTLNGFAVSGRRGYRQGGEAWSDLEGDAVLVIDDGKLISYLVPSDERIAVIAHIASQNEDLSEFQPLVDSLDSFPFVEDLLQRWERMDVSGESSQRAMDALLLVKEAEERNMLEVKAISRLNRFGYPLTMAGMVLAVVAFGHLLSNRPEGFSVSAAPNPTPQAMKAVSHSILYVVLLSTLDLVWTVLAWQAGQMTEMNPIASQFIHDPQQLVAFKSAATFLGAGILLVLRQHRSAQTASWWLCLVCTVLTFRWLTFNSMMMG